MGMLVDEAINHGKEQLEIFGGKHKEFIKTTIDDAPTVEAIPKADYENRLKTDLVAMLTEIQLEIEEMKMQSLTEKEIWNNAIGVCSGLIQEKINKLTEQSK